MSGAGQRVVPRIRGRTTIIPELPRKLAKRATQAQRQTQRETQRAIKKLERAETRDRLSSERTVDRELRRNVTNERRWRREDYTLGALAPKRDVGELADTFGAATMAVMNRAKLKTPKQWGIAVDDRVVVTKRGHPDRGKISKVKLVNEDTGEVTVEGLNVSDLAIPSYILLKEQDKTPVRPYEMPMKLSEVRLVAPLPDAETGAVRDAVIQELELRKLTVRERKGLDPPTRIVAGLHPPMVIPYPESQQQGNSETGEHAEEHDNDTLRIEVENRSWTPTLHMPPMPPAVLDELRNKFSRFRIRHDDAYIARVQRREALVSASQHPQQAARHNRLTPSSSIKNQADLMLTPLKRRRRLERAARKQLGRPELSDHALAHIGQVMLWSRSASTAGSSASSASSSSPSPVQQTS